MAVEEITRMAKIPARTGSELWQRLRAARKSARMSQDELGRRVGVSRAAVSQWEHPDPEKRTRPRWETLAEVAKVTGAPIDWLHDDTVNLESYWFSDESDAIEAPAGGKVVALFGHTVVGVQEPEMSEYAPIKRAGPVPSWVKEPGADDGYSDLSVRRGSPLLGGATLDSLRIVSSFDDCCSKYGLPQGTKFLVDTNQTEVSGSGFYFIEPAGVMRYVEVTLSGEHMVRPEDVPVNDQIRIAGKAIYALRRV